MTLPITITLDTKRVAASLHALAAKQIPFATATAVNDLAFQVMRAENLATAKVFKHPRPFTQKATQVERRATKASQSALVSVRDIQAKYLAPYEFGGVHVLPGPVLLNPKDVRLDQFGQLRKGQVKALMSRPDVFFGDVRGIKGIWQRLPEKGRGRKGAAEGQQLKLLVRFGVALPVHEHLQWADRAWTVVANGWEGAMSAAMARALATAR